MWRRERQDLGLGEGVWELGGKTKICKCRRQAETIAKAPTPIVSLSFSLTVFFRVKSNKCSWLKKKNSNLLLLHTSNLPVTLQGRTFIFFLLQGYSDILETHTFLPFIFTDRNTIHLQCLVPDFVLLKTLLHQLHVGLSLLFSLTTHRFHARDGPSFTQRGPIAGVTWELRLLYAMPGKASLPIHFQVYLYGEFLEAELTPEVLNP